MQDAFAYCAELVRQAERDRFLASLFAPAEHRGALHALYAFNVEVTRVREAAREVLPGEIRLQWWTDVLSGERSGEAGANPVAAALLATIAQHRLATGPLLDLIEARRFDLYDEPMADIAELETYAKQTSSVLFAAAVQILGGGAAEAVSEPAGVVETITHLLQSLPIHAARNQLYVPLEILTRHEVTPNQVLAGQSIPGLKQVLAEFRTLARSHLATLAERVPTMPREALPAFLPLALVRPSLDRLERGGDPFTPTVLSPWRRQWLIWRASRNPARIAG
jgi:15-cis-phytoene synthase